MRKYSKVDHRPNFLRIIKTWWKLHGRAPTIRELMAEEAMNSTSHVCFILDKMVQAGVIEIHHRIIYPKGFRDRLITFAREELR